MNYVFITILPRQVEYLFLAILSERRNDYFVAINMHTNELIGRSIDIKKYYSPKNFYDLSIQA